ncbi:MAG TPA: hypothetical protein DHW82_10290, partial [Spirochaetia bacterium]|nr:hypothetical protein [Spirochaetia bacterium]
MKKIIFSLLIFSSFTVYGLSPQGGQYLTFGDFPLSFQKTFYTPFLNPSSIQENERISADLAFGTLESESILGLGMGFPSLYGTFGFRFLYQSADTGMKSLLGFGGFYSRKIARDFYFGFGIKGFLIDVNSETGFILNADFGINSFFEISKIPFHYGIALVNIGLPAKKGGAESYPPLGLRAEIQPELALLDEKQTTSPFLSLFSGFYPFSYVLSAGVAQKIGIVTLSGGVAFDLLGDQYKNQSSVFLSLKALKDFGNFAVSGNYTFYPSADFDLNGKKEMKHLFSISFSFGSIDQSGPETLITPNNLIEKDNRIYLSPNEDNINDYLTFGLEITDPSVLQEWKFSVKNKNRDLVYETGDKISESQFTSQSLSQILKKKQGAFYPAQIVWPCVDKEGKKLPDGEYLFEITAVDFKGNTTKIGNPVNFQAQALVIDTVAPRLELAVADKKFSPNGDGSKDTIEIDHKNPSEIAKWHAEIRSNGVAVYRKDWDGKPDEKVLWDGKNEDGTTLPDGKYEYFLSAADKAGNSFSTSVSDILIDTKLPVVQAKALENYFSPNGDGIKDTIELEQQVDKKGIWTGEILNDQKEIVKKYEWKDYPSAKLVWDGKNMEGKVLPDGKYSYRLKGTDESGNKTEKDMTVFIIDNTPPKSDISVADLYFSPNNDGEKDFLDVTMKESSEEDFWKLDIVGKSSQIVKSYYWQGNPPPYLQENGIDRNNKVLPDGEYQLVLSSTDKAGNSFKNEVRQLVLDTEAPVLSMNVYQVIFSPNNDGKKDEAVIQVNVEKGDEAAIEIRDNSDNPVFTQELPASSGEFNWNGKNQENQTVSDGTYTVYLKAKDKAGNKSREDRQVVVLNLESKIMLISDKKILNPYHESFNKIQFQADIPEITLCEKIEVIMLDKEGDELFTLPVEQIPDNGKWSMVYKGNNDSGNYLKDGEYSQKIKVYYTNGDEIESNKADFRVDTEGPVLNLAFSPELFSPDGDGENDVFNVSLKAEDPSGISKWQIVIEDRFKEDFKSFQGVKTIPDNIQWDGFSNEGILTDSAEDFFIYAVAQDSVGNISKTEKMPFTTDILVLKTDRGYKIRISNIEFDLNKANLKPSGIKILDRVSQKLKKFPNYKVKIEGHADSTGAEAWNEKLSLLRSESVKTYFVEEKELLDSQFSTEGYGSRIPLYPNNNPKNRAKNRR